MQINSKSFISDETGIRYIRYQFLKNKGLGLIPRRMIQIMLGHGSAKVIKT